MVKAIREFESLQLRHFIIPAYSAKYLDTVNLLQNLAFKLKFQLFLRHEKSYLGLAFSLLLPCPRFL